jgi:hypothetical protein
VIAHPRPANRVLITHAGGRTHAHTQSVAGDVSRYQHGGSRARARVGARRRGPGNFLNFTFVPVRHQLMIVNVLGIGWTTFLSLLAAKNRLLEASGQRKQQEQKTPRPE